jgi:hypothetical protein
MSVDVRKILAHCVEAVEIRSPVSFVFGGRAVEATDPGAMVKALGNMIYDQCYCREFSGRFREPETLAVDTNGFAAGLSAANTSMTRWETGWKIDQSMTGGQFLATRHNRFKLVYPGEFVMSEYNPSMPKPGSEISIFFQKESTQLQPGFYYAFSNSPLFAESLFTLVRFYWNLRPESAAPLVESLTTRLNHYSIPFSFKCLADPRGYSRIDAGVLYVSKPYYAITARIIKAIHLELAVRLDDAVPWFTRRLGRGLALAEDPGNGESFGISRAHLVAKGILEAERSGISDPAGRVEAVDTVFRSQGLSLEQPYLNAGAKDIYDYHDE